MNWLRSSNSLPRHLGVLLCCFALTNACATSPPPAYAEKAREFREAVGSNPPVKQELAARFFIGLDAYERGDFETACRELKPLRNFHAVAALQVAALSADGKCGMARTTRDWNADMHVLINNLFVVRPGMHGMTFSGRSFHPREYVEAATLQRSALLSRFGGYQYYVGITNMVDWGYDPYDDAVAWLRKAAEARSSAARFELGQRFVEGGRGAEEGLEAGFKHIMAAAKQGFSPAEYLVAEYYFYGREPATRDTARAAIWYERAAQKGNSHAQYVLGVQYQRGWGVERDETRALTWFILAARYKSPLSTRARDELLSTLPAESISGARRAAEEWTAKQGIP